MKFVFELRYFKLWKNDQVDCWKFIFFTYEINHEQNIRCLEKSTFLHTFLSAFQFQSRFIANHVVWIATTIELLEKMMTNCQQGVLLFSNRIRQKSVTFCHPLKTESSTWYLWLLTSVARLHFLRFLLKISRKPISQVCEFCPTVQKLKGVAMFMLFCALLIQWTPMYRESCMWFLFNSKVFQYWLNSSNYGFLRVYCNRVRPRE